MKEDAGSDSFLLLYNEPDSHLDYPLQTRVARLLAEQAQITNVQVVVATHSRNLIDGVPLESILVFKLDESLCTLGSSLSNPLPDHHDELKYQSEIYMSLGLRNSILLDDRVFLIVEGKTEYSALPILFHAALKTTMAQSGIIILETDGSGAAHEFALKLRSRWNKPVVLMLDSDFNSRICMISVLARMMICSSLEKRSSRIVLMISSGRMRWPIISLCRMVVWAGPPKKSASIETRKV